MARAKSDGKPVTKGAPSKTQAAPPQAPPSGGAAKLTRFQKFEPRRLHRRDLKKVAWNPRVIDDFAYKRLKDKLSTRGLLNALVWNEKTGDLVSGHQRLTILDALEAHDVKTGKRTGEPDDYLIDVDVVKLSLKQEREENVFFNHQGVQGTWDLAKLAELGNDEAFDFDAAGFTDMEIALTFEGSEFETIFSEESQPEAAASMATIGDMVAAGRAEAKGPDAKSDADPEPAGDGDDDADAEPYDGAPLPADADAPHGRLANGDAIRDPVKHAALIAERDKMRDKMAAANEARDPEFFLTIVCRDRAHRERLAQAFGKDRDTRMIDAAEVAFKLSLDLE